MTRSSALDAPCVSCQNHLSILLPFSSIPSCTCVVDEHGCTVGYTNKTKYSTKLLAVKVVLFAGTETPIGTRSLLSRFIISIAHTAMHALPLSLPQIDILEIRCNATSIVCANVPVARAPLHSSTRKLSSAFFVYVRIPLSACVCLCLWCENQLPENGSCFARYANSICKRWARCSHILPFYLTI